jgi:hypothetical protein
LKSELGEELASRKYFERFLEHWGRADSDLPDVRDARRRLARQIIAGPAVILPATRVLLSYSPDCANSSFKGTTMSGFCVRSASFVSRMPSEVWTYARFVLGSMTHTERTPKER